MTSENKLYLESGTRSLTENRRKFLKTFLFVLGFLVAWPIRLARAKKLAISLDKVEPLQKVGGALILKIKDREILFIRDSEESIRSLDPTCTHEKCQVAYNAEKKTIDCPCHGSRYDLEGNVLHGPAPKPLESFDSYIDTKNRIILSLEDAEE
jgi:Rieske Fe-S protein